MSIPNLPVAPIVAAEKADPFFASAEKGDLESPGASTLNSLDAPLKDWTDAEEAIVRRKLDFLVMPLLMLGFFVFQLERGNISNAITSTFFVDVGIDQNQFNTGQGVLYLGIVLLEIPSNILLLRVGAPIWISFQVLAFGLVSTLQYLQNSYGSFLACRIMLGVTESGYIPGALYVISTFYKRSELAGRNAAFFLGSGLASAVTGLFAYGILQLEGRSGLAGWQWLFLIEGLLAIFVAFLFILFLPSSPLSPRPLFFNLPYFTERQRHILAARVINDDANKSKSSKKVTVSEVLSTLANPRIWPHVLLAVSLIAATASLSAYVPTLIKGFGFTTLKANALSSVAGWCGLIVTLSFGVFSDRTGLRGPSVIAAVGLFWLFWVAFQQVSTSTDKWLKYALLVVTTSFNAAYHPLNASWLSLNVASPTQRSIAMAMFVMAANTGAAVGSQIMRKGDSPLYRTGFRACVGLTSFGLLVAILQHFQYRWSNKKIDETAEERDSEKVVRRYVI
ncbi:major facilitator superfamily domain-containing protein [Leucosporidium creatinivorum]|uniref:Major facilitator superfamily domain-containing protein n=1 Tax=Leucosporidium creatinivorum TaxID=106004 RepID=A0A1Y2DFH4_9BASI|nr:major facilitator superfamily domain-containing protein [Leucosporidium creatinivorum]